MPQNRIKWTEGRVIVAFGFILIGLLLLMPHIGFDWSLDLWDFWPCLLILQGISVLGRSGGRRADGWLWIGFGVLFMGSTLGFYRMDIDFIWPLLIIAVGVMLLLRSRTNAAPSGPAASREPAGDRRFDEPSGIRGVSDSSDSPEILWVLGGTHLRIDSRRFRAAQVTSILSKGKVDLTRAEPEGEASLDVLSILGTVEILVPRGWEIEIRGTSLIGDMKNETAAGDAGRRTGSPAAKKLTVKGLALLGDVFVRNG
ncbi:MAG: LiaF-related protein [bacterium]|nr:LiaF-related protein [bacterium]